METVRKATGFCKSTDAAKANVLFEETREPSDQRLQTSVPPIMQALRWLDGASSRRWSSTRELPAGPPRSASLAKPLLQTQHCLDVWCEPIVPNRSAASAVTRPWPGNGCRARIASGNPSSRPNARSYTDAAESLAL